MHSPSTGIKKLTLWIVPLLAVLAAGAMIYQASYSAFSATQRNAGNSWSTGMVTLSDDDSGQARFDVSSITPGQTATKCITVTSTSSVPGVVKLYTIDPLTSSNGLENYIMLTITSGSGGSFGSCTGYTAANTLATNQSLASMFSINSFANGLGAWAVTGNPGGESLTYQLTWTFNPAGLTQSQLDQLQGSRTGVDFQWEMQSS